MEKFIKNYVQELRRNTTDTEKHLWFSLRAKRAAFLNSKGYKVLRFWNNEVLEDTKFILMVILSHLKE